MVTPHAEGRGYAGERAQRTLQFEIRRGAAMPAAPRRVAASNGVGVHDVALRVRATIAAHRMDSVWTLTPAEY